MSKPWQINNPWSSFERGLHPVTWIHPLCVEYGKRDLREERAQAEIQPNVYPNTNICT